MAEPGALHREFGYITSSEHKIKEAERSLSPYGIVVKQLDPKEYDTDQKIEAYLRTSNHTKKFIVMGVIREQTVLINEITRKPASFKPAEPVIHQSTLLVRRWVRKSDQFVDLEFKSETSGYIDLTKRKDDPHKYDWDDIFVVRACHRSYVELAHLGRKISPRDKNLDTMIKEIVHYEKPVDLAHKPQGYSQCVDFSRTLRDYIEGVPEFDTEFMHKSGLRNILVHACNQGAGFKAPTTRLQKLYWCPGLNAFIPLTPKPRDPHHELTFQFHDFSHFNMPDLVFDGVVTPLHKLVYIVYRLISESSTLTLADMMFVWTMVQSGYTYETADQRKIYPVFAEVLKKHPEFMENPAPILQELLTGSYEHCFFGDNARWRTLMADDKPLEAFSGKYDKYFMEDFRWTRHNWDDMARSPEIYAAWWYRIKEWRKFGHNLELQSVSEFIDEFKLDKIQGDRPLLDAIFNAVFTKYWSRIVCSGQKLEMYTPDQQQRNRFVRYMMGQSIIFFTNPHWEARRYCDLIEHSLTHDVTLDLDTIANIRFNYNAFLHELVRSSLISEDERANYAQICPIFETCIVDYDHGDFNTPIAEYVRQILDLNAN